MATTEQRTGFRLPWSSDARATTPGENDVSAAATDAATEVRWPAADSDAGAVEPTRLEETPVAASATRPNPLRAELARAMHNAAETARGQAMERLAVDAGERIEAIRVASAAGVAALKGRADADVAAIRERTKTELARIREDADRQTAERKASLEHETEAHVARVELRIERVRATVAAFEAEMGDFFEALLAEEDPTRLALIAERMPEPPGLDAADELGDLPEPVLALETDDVADDRLTAEGAETAESEALVGAVQDGDTGQRAVADGSVRTDVAATGLISVASIAGFKRAISQLPGVAAVGVTSGPNGEFIFGVSHEPGLDLAGAFGGLPGFETRVTAAPDGRLHVAARDLAN